MGGFAALATLALAISCHGFFVNPTLTSIAISPTAPQVQQGKTVQLQAFGTFDDGTRNQIKTGVSWSSDTSTIATIDTNTGILTGVSTGTSTITASAQALSSTATATVFLVITSITIDPTSASVANGGLIDFTVSAGSNGGTVDLTSSATLTAEQGGQVATAVQCVYDSTVSPPAQVCTTTPGVTGVYQIVASYSGSTLTATANLTVN
jgi:trimeric autotransporter adhesin